MPRLEQLEHFIEQTRRRHVMNVIAEFGDRLGRLGGELEIELGRKPHDAQHPHRVFPIARSRIADQAQRPAVDVLETRRVVPDAEVGDVVVEGVDREVATPDVLVDRPVDVVAKDPGPLSERVRSSPPSLFARKVATSMISRPNRTCASRNRLPISRQFEKSFLTCSGWASVTMSKSFGCISSNRSRTPPPTRYAAKPEFFSR